MNNKDVQTAISENKKIIPAKSEAECPNNTDFQPKDSNPKQFKNKEQSKINEYDRKRDKIVVYGGFLFIFTLCIAMIVLAFFPGELVKQVIDFFKNVILIVIGYIFSRYISNK